MIPGVPNGILVAGQVDKILWNYKGIHDYKTHAESSQKFKGAPDPNVAAQLNIYRIALEQVVPAAKGQFEELVAYHGAMTSARGPEPWKPVVEPFMSEEEILKVHPGGGDYTALEVILEYIGFFERQAQGMPVDENLGRVALIGRTMYRKTKCELYCQPGVRGICDAFAGIVTL